MALKGLDIFKLTPKTNCKECGVPTCMAFSMKVAQGAMELGKCPYLSQDVIDQLSEATAPPMRTFSVGAGDYTATLGGETVLMRHDKTFVNKCLYAVRLSDDMEEAERDAKLNKIQQLDYERIGERMVVDALFVSSVSGDVGAYTELVEKAVATGRVVILDCTDPSTVRAAIQAGKASGPLLHGATPENLEEMQAIASEHGIALGLRADNLSALYDGAAALEKLGQKEFVLDVGTASAKDAFRSAVEIRRTAITDGDRTFGYPSLVNVAALAPGDPYLQAALASLFTSKYGSIIVVDELDYPLSLPLHGLRQNMFTDPQKPMTVEPGIYPINGADENAPCVTTVDFALTYFVVSGELERSGVPVNLLISDSGGYSVLTAWAAGKLSASSLAKFFEDYDIENKIKSRTLMLPGKVAVLKGELEDKLPGWTIVVAPNEAIELVKFMRDFQEKEG